MRKDNPSSLKSNNAQKCDMRRKFHEHTLTTFSPRIPSITYNSCFLISRLALPAFGTDVRLAMLPDFMSYAPIAHNDDGDVKGDIQRQAADKGDSFRRVVVPVYRARGLWK